MSATERPSATERGPFNPVTVIVLIAFGLLTFAAATLLSVYAPNNHPTNGTKAHALSNAAVGYGGIVRLARETGHMVSIVRDEKHLRSPALLVVTPPTGATPLGDLIAAREGLPTLIVLPKWTTFTDPHNRSWVVRVGLLPKSEPEGVLAPANRLSVSRTPSGGRPLMPDGFMDSEMQVAAPRPLQSIAGRGLKPLLTDADDRIVLAAIGDAPFYVLADPDLLSNMGIRTREGARAALTILETLDEKHAGIDFDVTAVGMGRQPSPLALAFDPPFLAMTLTILAAMLLAGWQAFARFGPAIRPARAIAFGKRALVDNSAMLIRKAGRQTRMGGRYVEVIRDRAITAFGVPARLRDEGVDAYLDRLPGRARFSDLAAAARDANDNHALVQTTRALHEWQRETKR